MILYAGTHKVAERYSVGKKTTDCALEISNLDKKEVITMDTISNQDFTQVMHARTHVAYTFICLIPIISGEPSLTGNAVRCWHVFVG